MAKSCFSLIGTQAAKETMNGALVRRDAFLRIRVPFSSRRFVRLPIVLLPTPKRALRAALPVLLTEWRRGESVCLVFAEGRSLAQMWSANPQLLDGPDLFPFDNSRWTLYTA